MRTWRNLSAILTMVTLLTSCSDEAPGTNWVPSQSVHHLYTPQSSLSFDATACNRTLEVKSVSTPWALTGMADWLTVSAASGNNSQTVTVHAAENLSTGNGSATRAGENGTRTCIFMLQSTESSYAYSHAITASQAAAKPSITLSTNSCSFPVQGGSSTITVSSNITYDVVIEGSPSWLKVSVSDGGKQLTVTADPNPTADERHTTVTLSGAASASFTVSQSPAGITGDAEVIAADPDGGTGYVQIEAEAAWAATNNGYSWIGVAPSEGGAGRAQVVLTIAPNMSASSRSGVVTFRIGSKNLFEKKIEQKGIQFEVLSKKLDFDAGACERSVDVTCNSNWQVISLPDWITIGEQNYHGNQKLTFKASANDLLEMRTGVIILGIPGVTGLQQEITVSQAAQHIEAQERLEFESVGGTKKLSVTTDAQWTVTANQSWVHPSPTSGQGNAELTVKVDENPGDNARNCVISINIGKSTIQVEVYQKGHFFTVDPGTLASLPSTGGTHQISINTDDSWTAKTKSNWLSLSQTSGQGNINVTLTASDNPSIKERKDTVTFHPAHGQDIRVIVPQAGRYLTLSHASVTLSATGGTSEPIIVTTDGTYTVTTTASWLTIKQEANTFTLTASAYEGTTVREGKVLVTMTNLKAGEEYALELPVKQEANPNFHNGYGYVDLGLSVNWATCNVGATIPEMYGNFYAWGETSTKSDYTWSTYKYGTEYALTKYNSDEAFGKVDKKNKLDNSDDAARAVWGGNWRMPTLEEFYELMSHCTRKWTTRNGVKVMEVTGPNGNFIYLPATGLKTNSTIDSQGVDGWYWTSEDASACHIFTTSTVMNYYLNWIRCNGCCIRPVLP